MVKLAGKISGLYAIYVDYKIHINIAGRQQNAE